MSLGESVFLKVIDERPKKQACVGGFVVGVRSEPSKDAVEEVSVVDVT